MRNFRAAGGDLGKHEVDTVVPTAASAVSTLVRPTDIQGGSMNGLTMGPKRLGHRSASKILYTSRNLYIFPEALITNNITITIVLKTP